MSTIFVMEAANLFCGDHDPTRSKHLTLTDLKLPSLEEEFVDHRPAGGRVQVEVGMNVIRKLMPTFKLSGWDPDLLSEFGLGSRVRNVFSAYGVIRDKRTGEAIEAKAIIEGRLGKIEPENFRRGDLQSHDYAINEVLHYELYFNNREKFFWDFFTNTVRIDGGQQNADENRLLRIPTGL